MMRGTSARLGVRIGSTIGSYRIVDELGGGGMGMVYAAEHVLLGRRAAIKVLRPEFCHLPDVVQRLFNEARATTTIRHPGIVEIFDFGYNDDGHAYIVMELLDGLSLADRLLRDRRLLAPTALVLARRIALALGAAHQRAIVHRDLKPDNVFLVACPEGGPIEQVKVLDFGIAKILEEGSGGPIDHTSTGALLGTPVYMSPEQCRGAGECDHRSDLYSLGCTLYEMLVGRPPFLGAGAGEVIAAHLMQPPPDPRASDPSIPVPVATLVARLLAKRPEERFESAFAAATAMERILDDIAPGRRSAVVQTVAMDPAAAAPPAPRRRARWAVAAMCVVIAGTAAATLAAALRWSRSTAPAESPATPDAGIARTRSATPPPRPPPPPPPALTITDAGVVDVAPAPAPPRSGTRRTSTPRPPRRVAALDAGLDVPVDLGEPIEIDVDTTVKD